MRATFLPEPELEFGTGRHVDIRFGLVNHGPLDRDHPTAPRRIRVGVVGTSETVEGVVAWLERCRGAIPARASRRPYLFPAFPGCAPDIGLRSEVVRDPRAQRTIPQRLFDALAGRAGMESVIIEAAELFLGEVRYLAEETQVDVIICAVPAAYLDAMDEHAHGAMPVAARGMAGTGRTEAARGEELAARLDFHDLLKARTLPLGKPIQLVLPPTYDPTKRRRQVARPERERRTQDEATRAWNFHTALYYKAGGTPWRIARDPNAYTACYVGVSFYHTVEGDELHTSVAQVFDERGEGIVVRGGTARIAKEDRKPHLDAAGAERLLADALARYRAEHRTQPARVVLHKSSRFDDAESAGFAAAAERQGIDLIDLISLGNARTRLFRDGAYPPLRGTLLSLDAVNHVLYTRGSVDFYATYPGMYVPRPLLLRRERAESTPEFLAREILALSKMNWNSTQFDGDEPITLAAARKVSAILRYTEAGQVIAPRYSFYM